MDVKFGTSGLRGLATDLAAGAAFRHVHGFCAMLAETGKAAKGSVIFMARDRRASSPLLAAQAAEAIRLAGFQPADCGEVPTPALACHAFGQGSAAVMITGSHIPADRNGVKFYLPGAEVAKSDEAAIAAHASAAPDLPAFVPLSGNNMANEVMSGWRSRYFTLLPEGFLSGFRIGIHEHSSVATAFLGELLARFGAQIFPFGKTAEFTPVDTEAVGPQFISLYGREARSNGLDAIVSADADGDRPLLAAEDGQPVAGDLLGWLAAQWAGADAVATPVTSNSAIGDSPGMKVFRTRVGSPFVIEAMNAAMAGGSRCVAGFEANGGFLLGSPATINGVQITALPTRDSAFPILAALRVMRSGNLKASELAGSAGFRNTASDRLSDFPAERSSALMDALNDPSKAESILAPAGKIVRTEATDGLRFFLSGGEVVHFRPSGNAPEMRCYAEAAEKTRVKELLRTGLDIAGNFQK